MTVNSSLNSQRDPLAAICRALPAHSLFVAAMAGIGILSLVYGDFALQWQPFPQWIPGRKELAYVSGALVLLSCLGVFFRRNAVHGALILTAYQLVWTVLRSLEVVPHPMSIGSWLGFCEALAVLIAAGLLCVSLARQGEIPALEILNSDRGLRVVQVLFGLSCLVFGVSHFAYAQFTAAMIPPWLPAHLWLAYFTGACHVAAGVAILLGIVPRLAATLEAFMMSSFVLLLHLPSLVASPPAWAPTGRIQWTALLMASALAGSAWILAGSLGARSRCIDRGPCG